MISAMLGCTVPECCSRDATTLVLADPPWDGYPSCQNKVSLSTACTRTSAPQSKSRRCDRRTKQIFPKAPLDTDVEEQSGEAQKGLLVNTHRLIQKRLRKILRRNTLTSLPYLVGHGSFTAGRWSVQLAQ